MNCIYKGVRFYATIRTHWTFLLAANGELYEISISVGVGVTSHLKYAAVENATSFAVRNIILFIVTL
jgi:hypothetical protein